MVNYKLTEASALFVFVMLVLVGESQGVQPHLGAQQVITSDLGASEIALSLLVNQVTLLKMINESSSICSLHEREIQQNRDLKMELDAKTEELKNELQDFTEAALSKLRNMTTATINDIDMKNQEARQLLNDVRETAVNVSRLAVPMMTTTAPPPTDSPTTVTLITTTPPPLECEDNWSQYRSSCYKVFRISANYDEATESCQGHGGYLASIGNKRENSFVSGLIDGFTYIGLEDNDQEGVYTWQDGSPFTFSKWSGSNPNGGENENCVQMWTDSSWIDYRCTNRVHYVCEKSLQ